MPNTGIEPANLRLLARGSNQLSYAAAYEENINPIVAGELLELMENKALMAGNSEFAIMVPPGGEATPNSSNPSHTLQLWKLITKFLGFMNIILSRSNSRIKR